MVTADVVEGLRASELFASLDEQQLEGLVTTLAGSCQMESYEPGDTVYTQGEHTTRLYVIAEGQVVIERTFYLGNRKATKPIALLGKGRALGWSALLYEPRDATASIVCQKPTRVISIEGSVLRSVLEGNPNLGCRVMERLAYLLGDRLRAAYSAMETPL